MAMIWPIALVVLSNTFYQICAKSMPNELNPLASLTIIYLISAVASALVFFVTAKDTSLLQEYSKVNWTTFVFGLCLVGLEVGMIYSYKAGWPVSTLAVTQAAILAIVLLFVGRALYAEAITGTKIVGLIVCLVGLALLNR